MARRKADPFAKREYEVEFYKRASDMTKMKGRSGFTMDIFGARVSAVKHLILGHAEKAVCIKRRTGREVWARVREGQNIIYYQHEAEAFTPDDSQVIAFPQRRKK